MSTYEIDELKEELEGLSIQEKRERLEEMQAEIICEIEELESSLAATSLLLSEVEEEVNNGYNQQIGAALKKVIAAHGNQYPLLPNNTLDVEGLQFRFSRYCCEENKLIVDIEGRKHITRVRDFQKDFDAILKDILPEAHPTEKKFTIILQEGDNTNSIIQHIAEKLISVVPKIKEMAGEYKFVNF